MRVDGRAFRATQLLHQYNEVLFVAVWEQGPSEWTWAIGDGNEHKWSWGSKIGKGPEDPEVFACAEDAAVSALEFCDRLTTR